MPKKSNYVFSTEETKAIQEARKTNKDKRIELRLRALELRAEGEDAKDISALTGFHPAYVCRLCAKYRKGGLEALAGNHYRGNRRNMGAAEEAGILEPFLEAAKKGQVVEVSAIKAAYEEACGHKIGGGQIYYVLKRHGWRKVMPRGRHPKKASDEAMEASKKSNKIWAS